MTKIETQELDDNVLKNLKELIHENLIIEEGITKKNVFKTAEDLEKTKI